MRTALCMGDLWTAGRLDDGCRRSGHPGGPTLAFLYEFGSPTYAMMGADGHEPSDRCPEALEMHDTTRTLWRRVELEGR